MASMRFTKSHERKEGRLLKRGFVHSWIGLALCWLPAIGLLFSASGFIRVMVRLTRRHQKKRRAYLVFSFLALAVCTGVLLGELWVYSRDPEILDRTAQQVWTFIVGEENAGALSGDVTEDGTAYGDMDAAGLGVMDSAWLDEGDWTEEDWAAEGFSELEDDFDWAAWEEEEWGLEGAETIEDDEWIIDEASLEWSEEDWEDDSWFDGEWSDEELTAEDSLAAAEDDLTALSDEEMAWLEDDAASLLGESSAQAVSGALSIGKGETILPPLE